MTFCNGDTTLYGRLLMKVSNMRLLFDYIRSFLFVSHISCVLCRIVHGKNMEYHHERHRECNHPNGVQIKECEHVKTRIKCQLVYDSGEKFTLFNVTEVDYYCCLATIKCSLLAYGMS